MQIKENILKIKERISSVCSKIQKDPGCVTIVAISKGRPVGQIKEAVSAGVADIGENRVQEAVIKYDQLRAIKWHMVGHLQTNKARDAVRIFDLIQSVDSARLAAEINRQAARINKIQDILIQVNTSGELAKFGLKPDDTVKVIEETAGYENIRIKGLMTIAPIADNPEKTRPYFRILRELMDKINLSQVAACLPDRQGCRLQVLSMGMTDDFEVAIEEGSNMVRLGRAIFKG